MLSKKTFEPQARTPAGEAFSALIVKVMRLDGLLIAAGNALAGHGGQTSAGWRVMAAIESRPASVAVIARRLGLTRQSVQRVANMLEQQRFAAYLENPKSERAKLLKLTSVGKAALVTIEEAQRPWANEIGARLGQEDLERTSWSLNRIMMAMSEIEIPAED
jgi:DNA-binding MarR family transcriptional regulator